MPLTTHFYGLVGSTVDVEVCTMQSNVCLYLYVYEKYFLCQKCMLCHVHNNDVLCSNSGFGLGKIENVGF